LIIDNIYAIDLERLGRIDMKFHRKHRLLSSVALAMSVSLSFALPAAAQTSAKTIAATTVTPVNASPEFSKFAPKTWTDKRSLDYGVWDDILQKVVVDFGPSSRKIYSRPRVQTGTRVTSGHSSPYRLEGSRVAFGFFTDNYRSGLTSYRLDLEDIANRIDITKLSRDEQLSFWFNLHNVTLVEHIALNYPERTPSTIKVDGVPLDDAKLLYIRQTPMSLRDIREKIVYSNWRSPEVIYGFWRGDIGGPRLPRLAYSSNSLEFLLNGNANEFVNALRGAQETSGAIKVSKVYEEAAPFFFPNFQADVTRHLRRHAEEPAKADLDSGKPVKVASYETDIADLGGGRRAVNGLALSDNLNPAENGGPSSLPEDVQRLLAEVGRKQQVLKQRGYYTGLQRGYVVIEDIETDPNLPPTPGSTID
jgi:hypothetical protein